MRPKRRRRVRAPVNRIRRGKRVRRKGLRSLSRGGLLTARPQLAYDKLRYDGPFTRAHAERLLFRAGFGPVPGQADAVASLGMAGAVQLLTRPAGDPVLTGPEPRLADGSALAPSDRNGHDHLAWLDRMVRTNQPLVERMALIWHDWFATSNADVNSQRLMVAQQELLRRRALGSFRDLLMDITQDPAMLLWLDNAQNRVKSYNENFARELMELFTLGADRGAYTEDDVRELTRALTGFRYDNAPTGPANFRYDPARHDTTNKTVFGQTGAFEWWQAVDLCLQHPLHASYFVTKLWSYFVPIAPDAETVARMEKIYRESSFVVAPVVEFILQHPALYLGPSMVKPPVVYSAGLMRGAGQGVVNEAWFQNASTAGQRLHYPPDVAGWDHTRWLDTSTIRGRWLLARKAVELGQLPASSRDYDPTETPELAVLRAHAYWGSPTLTPETLRLMVEFAFSAIPPGLKGTAVSSTRAQRQNALRHLIATAPDVQVS